MSIFEYISIRGDSVEYLNRLKREALIEQRNVAMRTNPGAQFRAWRRSSRKQSEPSPA